MNRIAPVLVTIALLLPASAFAQRAPYLQLGNDNAVHVLWTTLWDTNGTVCYGPARDELIWQAGDGTDAEHNVRLTGLEPSTRYWYYAGEDCDAGTVADADMWFDTAPVVGTPEPTRLWVVGDSGTGGLNQRLVRDAALDWAGDEYMDLFLHMGDMAYSDGEELEFTLNFFQVYAGILQNTVTWPTMGNHEGHTSDGDSESGPYYEAYHLPRAGEAGGMPSGTETYYSFDYANIHFIVLNSYDVNRSTTGAMLTWMADDLASTDQDWIIAYWHHPAYTKGSHDSDTEGQLIDMRENALPILEAGGVDLVLAGHSHIYERSWLINGFYETPSRFDETGGTVVDVGDGRPEGDGAYQKAGDGAVYIVAGHGGAGVDQDGVHPLMYFIEDENGSVFVDVDGATMSVVNVRYDGAVTDSFTLSKQEGLFVTNPREGNEYQAASELNITWASVGETGSGSVHIDWTVDGGVNWYRAAEGIPDDGHFAWAAPSFLTDDAEVRVIDAADTDRRAYSGEFSLVATGEFTLVPWGGVWEYSDDDTDHMGSGWDTETGGWPTGNGQLGYGDGDEATLLRDEDPNIPTAYFRTGVAIPGSVLSASLRVLHDDGFVAWINGVEVARNNVISTGHDAFTPTSGDDNLVWTDFLSPTELGAFIAGENVIAVIVKQRSEGSSDLSFDAELVIETNIDVTGELPDDPLIEGPGVGGDDTGVDVGGDDVGVDTGLDTGVSEDGGGTEDTGGADDTGETEDATGGDDSGPAEDSGASDTAAGDDSNTGGSDDTNPGGSDDAGGSDQDDDAPNQSTASSESGCGCSTTPDRAPLGWLGLAAIGLLVRRRR